MHKTSFPLLSHLSRFSSTNQPFSSLLSHFFPTFFPTPTLITYQTVGRCCSTGGFGFDDFDIILLFEGADQLL